MGPFKPLSVLSFFLGVDYGSKTSQTLLRDGSAYKEMSPIWFSMGNKEYDTLCQSFSEVYVKVHEPRFLPGEIRLIPKWLKLYYLTNYLEIASAEQMKLMPMIIWLNL